MHVVLEEGLDISILQETLKKDFDQMDQLEGQYRVTNILKEVVDRKGPPCPFCDVKEELRLKQYVERHKPIITLSKVILSGIVIL